MAIDNYKIFDGTNWISPCDCEAQVLTPTGWVKLDPRNCPTSYWDGSQWCPIECFEPCKKCPEGYIVDPVTKIKCIKYSVPDYDGTMRLMSPGANLGAGSYGKYGLALFNELNVSTGNYLLIFSYTGQIKSQAGATISSVANILYSGYPGSVPLANRFVSNVWYYRLMAIGLMEYKYDVWNKKKAYTINTIVLFKDGTIWKKYKCISAVSANSTNPFNLNPKLATTKWSDLGAVNTVYTTQGSNADINEEYTEFSFTVCLTLDSTKVYHLGFSADNKCSVDIQLNQTGSFVKLVEQTYSEGWNQWRVLPIKLPAGTHVLKLKGINEDNVGSIGLEIYDFNKTNSSSVNPVEKFKELFVYKPGTTAINAASHTGDLATMLEPYIVFSTLNMRFKEVPKVNELNPATNAPYVPTCPNGTAVSYCNGAPSCITIVDCNAVIEIDENTEINIWFDDSGSMRSTLSPLQTMQSTILKNCLLPVYNNDSALYDNKVRVLTMSQGPNNDYYEAFVTCISEKRNFLRTPDSAVKLVINLVFADESDAGSNINAGYHNSLIPISTTARSTRYDSHVSNAKANLAQAASDGYVIKGYEFRVATLSGGQPNIGVFGAYRELVEKTFVDTGGIYTSQYTLADQAANNIFLYDLDVTAGSTAAYYKDKIIEALQSLGINVPICPLT